MFNNGLSITIFSIAIIFSLVTLYYLGVLVKDIIKKERKFESQGVNGITTIGLCLLILVGFAYCLYNAAGVLIQRANWVIVMQTGPSALYNSVLVLAVVVPLFFVYFILQYFFVKPNEKSFFVIITLSIVSGIGNSLIIFIINEALNRSRNDESRAIGIESGLYIYFLFGILLFVSSSWIVKKRLNTITNNVVFDMRMKIIDKLFKTSYNNFESIEQGKIFATLNNDTETISNSVNLLVNFSAGFVMMITCYIYLGTLNLYGMILSVLIIALAIVAFVTVSRSAEVLYQKSRDYQNIFFKFLNDLVGGFKELYINSKKNKEFYEDLQESCTVYRDTRTDGENKFVGVTIFGSIMYLFVIGIVVFTFPIIFDNIRDDVLSNYVMVYLYLGSIINQQIYLIPNFMRVLVSWKRIKGFLEKISKMDGNYLDFEEGKNDKRLTVKLNGLMYQYKNENSENFSVGPIDYELKSGEVIFISGGNGSGKSTLAKLITGVYVPDEGEITINGEKFEQRKLGNYFSTVYSDFHLFEKLYGIDYATKEDEINKYLEMLHIKDKVKVENGTLSTVKLSTGQRKRLALLISYLEDRPIYLFDEWAADQDPEFRKYFYNELLPGLKERGKIVIAITHDDRYFDLADKHIKMDMGKILDSDKKSITEKEEAIFA